MDRRRFLLTSLAGALAAPLAAEAQPAGKVYRIGFLRNGPPPKTFIEGFRQGLRELGYVEGQNITLEYGLAGSADQLLDAATELVRRKVDVMIASGTPPVPVAKRATTTIPIIFVALTRSTATSAGRCATGATWRGRTSSWSFGPWRGGWSAPLRSWPNLSASTWM